MPKDIALLASSDMRVIAAYRMVGDNAALNDFSSAAKPASLGGKKADLARSDELAKSIGALQRALYAERKHKLLVVLQGMDTSGKDGVIGAVFSRTQPLGVRAYAFKAPTEEEASRDYLWRVHQRVPARGEIGVFNRSHYEAVIAERVLGLVDSAECTRRFAHINAFEQMLSEEGTRIVKCFLHISPETQKRRLQDRIDDPTKQWKFDPHDLVERKRWAENHAAYNAALTATATDHAPWWVIPSDSESHRNLMVAAIVESALIELAPKYPPLAAEHIDLKVE